MLKAVGQAYVVSKAGELPPGGEGNDGAASFGSGQIINFASRFAESLNSLIRILNKNQTQDDKQLQGYKVVFRSYKNMVDIMPANNLKIQATELIECAIELVDQTMKDKNAVITDQLEALAEELKPFMAANQHSPTNNTPISVSGGGSDSSNNELFKAQLAQQRLANQEQRLESYRSDGTNATINSKISQA